MRMEPTIETTQTLSQESPGSNTNTGYWSVSCLFHADHKELTQYLEHNQVQHSVLDDYLLSGFQMVQKKDRELGQIAHALKLLLELGAKWKDGVLLENQMTPHHLICQSNGDYHELLDLITADFSGTLINSESHARSTALLYAVKNANIQCVKSLIAKGANVNQEDDCYRYHWRFSSGSSSSQGTLSPIIETIKRLNPHSEYSSIVMTDILDLLLDSGVNVNQPYRGVMPIYYAVIYANALCVKKLIKKGAHLSVDIWPIAARMGSVELLKCMLKHGIDKEDTDIKGRSLFSNVVQGGNVEAIRYLLDLGVTMISCATRVDEISCRHCSKNRLLIDTTAEDKIQDPHMVACHFNMLDVVQLLEEYGNQNFKSINALRCAVIHDSGRVVEYLLDKYNYPLNVEYARKCGGKIDYQNILIEACKHNPVQVMELLLCHGANPNKSICNKKCPSVLNTAIVYQNVDVVSQFIKWGVDINNRSYDPRYGNILPFEAAVLYNNKCTAEMLLISGCSCGVLSLDTNHMFNVNVESRMKKLMKKWNVHENNVTSLQIQCRRMILKHLSPRAFNKLEECALPRIIVLYLGICELNDVVEEYIKESIKEYLNDN